MTGLVLNSHLSIQPPITDIYARYDAESFSGTTWFDKSGNGRHASVTRGSVSVVSSSANGSAKSFSVLQGGTNDGILFPTDVLPSTYTLFHVTRYNTGTNARIFTGKANNWLSGFWGNESGVAYHEGWLTSNSQRKAFQNDWVISTDQNSLYRGNALTYGTSGGSASARLSLNDGSNAEYSAWQCAEVIVFNRTLSATEYAMMENYLNEKYGLDIYGTRLPSSQFLYLDAADTSSYSGSGTTWSDISGNARNFTILAAAYNSASPKYMSFVSGKGIAKNGADLSLSGNVTYCAWTRPLTSSSGNWRTLTRGYGGDHQVIIESGGHTIGMYDNDGANFISSGYSQQGLPGYNSTRWNFMCWRWQSEKLYYSLVINDTPNIIRGSSSNSSAQYNRGFGSLGGYHNENTSDASVGSQFWGDISQFIVYNRYLTDSEVLAVYNLGKTRHGV